MEMLLNFVQAKMAITILLEKNSMSDSVVRNAPRGAACVPL